MARIKVYDEKVPVDVLRDNERITVPFCELKEYDEIASGPHAGDMIMEAAHRSGDPAYGGWLCYNIIGDSYYPEDFGAKEIEA